MLSGAFRRAWSQAHTDVFALAMNMRIMMYLQLCEGWKVFFTFVLLTYRLAPFLYVGFQEKKNNNRELIKMVAAHVT